MQWMPKHLTPGDKKQRIVLILQHLIRLNEDSAFLKRIASSDTFLDHLRKMFRGNGFIRKTKGMVLSFIHQHLQYSEVCVCSGCQNSLPLATRSN
ncbi:hypothetical protein AVEN_209421-1 [Araneus ventricosus]|uniref:Uncharacterized protein n=1 Tax=Araneus ventricosus TaxID=182803 RepID=A0A4Y2J824_ARAVE|nr:hypothetical protein AVEN_209421-1 [Araneus ventricosus]